MSIGGIEEQSVGSISQDSRQRSSLQCLARPAALGHSSVIQKERRTAHSELPRDPSTTCSYVGRTFRCRCPIDLRCGCTTVDRSLGHRAWVLLSRVRLDAGIVRDFQFVAFCGPTALKRLRISLQESACRTLGGPSCLGCIGSINPPDLVRTCNRRSWRSFTDAAGHLPCARSGQLTKHRQRIALLQNEKAASPEPLG
jgi:hypothetical protein